MTLSLSNLKAFERKKKRRLGRGDGSGSGTYSGRGLKGQRSRSGGRKNLKRKGLKQFLHQLPKSRGFKSIYRSLEVVNIGELDKAFKDGELITPDSMVASGLVVTKDNGIKVLGQGKLDKKLNIQAHSFSNSAKDAIKKAGGSIQILGTAEAGRSKQKK